jgi:hypothetical protein
MNASDEYSASDEPNSSLAGNGWGGFFSKPFQEALNFWARRVTSGVDHEVRLHLQAEFVAKDGLQLARVNQCLAHASAFERNAQFLDGGV